MIEIKILWTITVLPLSKVYNLGSSPNDYSISHHIQEAEKKNPKFSEIMKYMSVVKKRAYNVIKMSVRNEQKVLLNSPRRTPANVKSRLQFRNNHTGLVPAN